MENWLPEEDAREMMYEDDMWVDADRDACFDLSDEDMAEMSDAEIEAWYRRDSDDSEDITIH